MYQDISAFAFGVVFFVSIIHLLGESGALKLVFILFSTF